jgi:hypothetical protein
MISGMDYRAFSTLLKPAVSGCLHRFGEAAPNHNATVQRRIVFYIRFLKTEHGRGFAATAADFAAPVTDRRVIIFARFRG